MALSEFLKSPAFPLYLSGLGSALSQAGRGQGFDMSATNQGLMAMLLERKRREKLAGLMEQLGLPEAARGLLGTLAPDKAAEILASQIFPGQKDSALQEKVRMLMSTGIDQATAINIATGRYVASRDPITGAVQVVDKASGRPVGAPMSGAAGNAVLGAAGGDGGAAAPVSRPSGTLFEGASEAAGVVPAVKEILSDTAGQLPGIGKHFVFPETVEARERFRVAISQLVRALSTNSRNPVGEIQRVMETIGLLPTALASPESFKARMRSTVDLLRFQLGQELRAAQDPSLPTEARKEAAQRALAIQQFLEIAGVPADGTISETDGAQDIEQSDLPPIEADSLPFVDSDEAYQALPSGAMFVGPDGIVRRKP